MFLYFRHFPFSYRVQGAGRPTKYRTEAKLALEAIPRPSRRFVAGFRGASGRRDQAAFYQERVFASLQCTAAAFRFCLVCMVASV